MRSGVYVTVRCPSVSGPSYRSLQRRAAGLLLEISIDSGGRPAATAPQQRSTTALSSKYDTIRDAILTCAQKPT